MEADKNLFDQMLSNNSQERGKNPYGESDERYFQPIVSPDQRSQINYEEQKTQMTGYCWITQI
jgi:hypothetical protein